MPPLADFFGEFERLLGSLYPYRVPLGIAALIVIGLGAWQVRRRGLHVALERWVAEHRVACALAGAALLAVAVPLGNYTLSPLWERARLAEPSPLEVAGAPTTSPPGLSTDPGAPLAPSDPGPSTAAVTPKPSVSSSPRVLREGSLQGADAFHFGRGRVLLIEAGGGSRVLRFEGLSVRNGPDLFVYLSHSASEVDVATNLGKLKATDGDFNYELPATIDPAVLSNAVIWCRQFGVLFASAALAAAP